MEAQKKYYVYRFKDKEDTIIYVGRTKEINQRFIEHHALSDNIQSIEYIECDTYADSLWKEIYYINLFKNEHTQNKANMSTIDKATDVHLNDIWKVYSNSRKEIDQKREIYKLIDATKYYYEELYKMQPENMLKRFTNLLEDDKLNKIKLHPRSKVDLEKVCKSIMDGTYYKHDEQEYYYISTINYNRQKLLEYGIDYDAEYDVPISVLPLLEDDYIQSLLYS